MDDASASFRLFRRHDRLEVALEIGPTSPSMRKTSHVRSLKATKLKNAAQSTALKGVSTFVDTIVAMELAAS